MFYSIHYKNGSLAASDLFRMFTQSGKFYTFHYHILKSTYLKKWIHQTGSNINDCFFQQVLRQNLSWFLSYAFS